MSTLTGQSVLQPLQARHRSSASRTPRERQPSVIGESPCPSSISNSSRARPRVECSSSRGGLVGRAHHGAALVVVLAALADARRSGWRLRERPAVVRVGGRTGPAAWCGAQSPPSRRCSSSRAGCDELARVHLVAGIEDRLQLAERGPRSAAEHLRQQLTAGLAVAVLAGQRAAVGHDQIGGSFHEPPVVATPSVLSGRTGSGCGRSPGRSARTGWARCHRRSRIARKAFPGRAGSRRGGPGARPSLPSPPRCRACQARARSRPDPPRGPPTARPPCRVVEEGDVGLVPRSAERVEHAAWPPGRPPRGCRRRTGPSGTRCLWVVPPALSGSCA